MDPAARVEGGCRVFPSHGCRLLLFGVWGGSEVKFVIQNVVETLVLIFLNVICIQMLAFFPAVAHDV